MKKLLTLVIGTALLLSAFTSANAATSSGKTFSDVPKEHWAYTFVSNLTAKGIVDGVSEDKFNPTGNVTRAEYAKLVIKTTDAYRERSGAYSKGIAMTFTDVPGEAWYYESVKTAVDRGIIPNAEKLNPSEAITREEVAIWSANAMGYIFKEPYANNPSYVFSNHFFFADHKELSVDGQNALEFLGTTQIFTGGEPASDGKIYFKPKTNITRAESTVVLGRILNFRYQF